MSPLLPAVPSGKLLFKGAVVNTQPWSPSTNSDGGGGDYKSNDSLERRSESDDHDGFDTEESENSDDDFADEIAEENDGRDSLLGSEDTADEEEDLNSNDGDIETDDHKDSPTRELMQSLRLDGRIGTKPPPPLRGLQMATPRQTRLHLVRKFT